MHVIDRGTLVPFTFGAGAGGGGGGAGSEGVPRSGLLNPSDLHQGSTLVGLFKEASHAETGSIPVTYSQNYRLAVPGELIQTILHRFTCSQIMLVLPSLAASYCDSPRSSVLAPFGAGHVQVHIPGANALNKAHVSRNQRGISTVALH